MIIWVDDRLFRGGARETDRIALLRGAAIRRHTLIVSTDPGDTRSTRASPSFETWQATLPAQLRTEVTLLQERLDLVSGNAVARGTERLLVSEHVPAPETPGCWVTVDEALRAVTLPTCILVENAINDRAFLRRAMPPDWRERFDGWERAGLLRYENGGGVNEMAKTVELFLEDEHAKQAFGLPSKVWQLIHVLVYDHDGQKADQPGMGARSVEQACMHTELGARSHRLFRRDQEHYLPPAALKKIVELRIDNQADRARLIREIELHLGSGDERHFSALPRLGKNDFFKNRFEEPIGWLDEWFQHDDVWQEMTLLAEKIAAAI